MRIPFISSLAGRGFNKYRQDGTLTLKNATSVSSVDLPPPKAIPSSGCPNCQNQNVLTYRCSPTLLCTHRPGFHVECSKCGVSSIKSE